MTGLVADQLIGRRRSSVALKVCRRSHDHVATLRDPAGGHVGIGHSSCSQGNINAFVDQIHHAVLAEHPEFDLELVFDDRTAASVIMQGLTASHFATDFYPVQPGDIAFIHAAAGGVDR